jgi:glycosyltransferase 2 family protein
VDRARGVARWLLRVGVSAGIIAYILVDVDNADLRGALAAVRLQDLILPVIIFLAGQVLSGIKWGMLGRSVGLDKSWLEYVRFYYIGAFFNVFGLSTIGGDVVRGLYLGDGRRPVLALNSVIFDRVTGLALLMATGAAALIAFPQYNFPWLLSAACIAGGLALVVGWWTCPRLVRILPQNNRIRRQVEDDLGPFWRDTALLLRVSAVSIVFHLSQVAVQYYIARAAGAQLPFSYCLIIHPMLSLMMAMPVSIGGFGVREGGYLYFLTRIHVEDSIAVTMGILWFAMTAATGIIGGAIFLLSGAELPRLRARAQGPERMRGVA